MGRIPDLGRASLIRNLAVGTEIDGLYTIAMARMYNTI